MGSYTIHPLKLTTMRQIGRIGETHQMAVLVLVIDVKQEVLKPIFTGHVVSLEDEVSYSIIAYHTSIVMSGKAC